MCHIRDCLKNTKNASFGTILKNLNGFLKNMIIFIAQFAAILACSGK